MILCVQDRGLAEVILLLLLFFLSLHLEPLCALSFLFHYFSCSEQSCLQCLVSMLYYPRVCAEAQKSPSFCERNSGGHAPNRSGVTSHVISQCKVEERLAPEEEAVAVPVFVPAVIPFSCPAVPAMAMSAGLAFVLALPLSVCSPAAFTCWERSSLAPKVGETTVQTAWRSTVCLPESFLERRKTHLGEKVTSPVALWFSCCGWVPGPRSWKVPLYPSVHSSTNG